MELLTAFALTSQHPPGMNFRGDSLSREIDRHISLPQSSFAYAQLKIEGDEN